MQYTISINQKVFTEQFPELDVIDACIFDFISKFMASEGISRLLIGDRVYFWVSYEKIKDELPIIGITTKDRIYRRIRRLMKAGLLEAYPDNQKTQRTYFRQGKNFDTVSFYEPKVRRKNRTTYGAKTGRSLYQ